MMMHDAATSTGGQRAYISLLIRPESVTERDVAEAILPISRSDLPTLQMYARQVPPNIVYSCAVDEATAVVNALQRIGCEAFAPTSAEILGLGPTMKSKDLSLCGDGMAVELWREGSRLISPDDIDVFVRAKMSEKLGGDTNPSTLRDFAESIGRRNVIGMAGYGWSIGGAYGLAAGLYAARAAAGEAESRESLRLSAKLDLHTRDGTVYQIDGDKFGFEVLGDNRGYSDMVNIDRMCEFLSALAPHAAIDPYFGLFRAPPGVERLKFPQQLVNRDRPRFAFYSRWAALVYRHLASRG